MLIHLVSEQDWKAISKIGFTGLGVATESMLRQRFLSQNILFLCWQRKPSFDRFRAVNCLHFITYSLPTALKSCRCGWIGAVFYKTRAKTRGSLSLFLPTFFLILWMVAVSVINRLPEWKSVPWRRKGWENWGCSAWRWQGFGEASLQPFST